jgi:hypothetical protein
MSTGHRHEEGFGLNSQALDRLLKNQNVLAELFQYREIDESFDIPYLGGYSEDGRTIYFDRHLPKTIKLKRDSTIVEFNPVEILQLHESFEKTLIDVLHLDYAQAHKAATAYERRGLLTRYGPGWWDPYQSMMEKYIKADEHEKLQKLPKDLDMLPYLSPPVDRKLLAHMQKIMGLKKTSKQEAEYTPEGKPNRHCGPDKQWPHGYCRSYVSDNQCKKVYGYIRTHAVCALFEHDDD